MNIDTQTQSIRTVVPGLQDPGLVNILSLHKTRKAAIISTDLVVL